MRQFVTLLAIPVLSVSLQAQTGRIQGKVTTSAGKPVADVKIVLKRVDVNLTVEVVSKKDGSYLRIVDPKEFDITVEHKGFSTFKARQKVQIGTDNPTTLNITLLTPEEAAKQTSGTATPKDPSAGADMKGTEAYNTAVTLFNEKRYSEAATLVEVAHKSLTEALATAKSDDQKKEIGDKMAPVNKLLGLSLYEAGKADEANRKDLWTKAEPFIKAEHEKAPQELRFLYYMRDIVKAKGDAAAEKQFTESIEKIEGPKPENAYNQGVEAFNAGKMDEAKTHFVRATQISEKYGMAYYMLGMCEFGLGNLKATKANFQKYLELEPNGPKAAEVKELLKDPSLKNIK